MNNPYEGDYENWDDKYLAERLAEAERACKRFDRNAERGHGRAGGQWRALRKNLRVQVALRAEWNNTRQGQL